MGFFEARGRPEWDVGADLKSERAEVRELVERLTEAARDRHLSLSDGRDLLLEAAAALREGRKV